MISFAGAAVLVAACGNGPGSGAQNTPASVGVSSVGSGKPLNAKPTPAGITVERIDRRLQGATGPVDVRILYTITISDNNDQATKSGLCVFHM
jgi:hypothetical protein